MNGEQFGEKYRTQMIPQSQAARMLGISERTFRMARIRGVKPHKRPEMEYASTSLEAWINQKYEPQFGSIA